MKGQLVLPIMCEHKLTYISTPQPYEPQSEYCQLCGTLVRTYPRVFEQWSGYEQGNGLGLAKYGDTREHVMASVKRGQGKSREMRLTMKKV